MQQFQRIHWAWVRSRISDVLIFGGWFVGYMLFAPRLLHMPLEEVQQLYTLSLSFFCAWFMIHTLIRIFRQPDRYYAEELETILAEAQQGRVMVPANDGGYRIYKLHVPTGEWESRWVADWEDVIDEQTNLSTQMAVEADR